MANIKKAGILVVAALSAALLAFTASTAGAQEGDLDCGDPGTSPNMSVPADDPHGLDRDGNGIGCEEDGGGSTPAPAEPEAPAPSDDMTEPAEPAEPVAEEPDYTG